MNTLSLTARELSELTSFLTPQERAEMDRLLSLSSERAPEYDDLTAFKTALYKRYMHAPHLEALDRALEQVTLYVESAGQLGVWLLIVEMPPRHGKTLTVSRYYPAWHLGRNPDHRIMLVSYGATLAHKNSRYARNIVDEPAFQRIFPGIELDRSSRAVDAWDLSFGERDVEGGGDALGVLGGATGKGAHVLICDDLIKNRQEAESEQIRERTWDALQDDLLSRLEPGGAMVLMATRWHEDDPTGRMLRMITDPAKCNGPVKRLRLVALPEVEEDYEADHQAGIERDPSGALWKERYPRRVLEATRERIGAYSWSSLYQQRPTPAEGGLFKRAWFTPVTQVPDMQMVVRFWDLAMSEKDTADYTVGVKMGLGVDWHYYVLDVARRRIDWDYVAEFIAEIILDDGPNVVQGLEQAGYMSRAVKDLNADARLHNYAIFGYDVEKDKWVRALPVAAKFSTGQIHIVLAGWNTEYINELCAFNNGAHDDQVDATSGAWAMLDVDTDGTGHMNYADDPGISSGVY